MEKWLPDCILDGYGEVHFDDFRFDGLSCGVSSNCFFGVAWYTARHLFPFSHVPCNDISALVCEALNRDWITAAECAAA
jgi:hypothetical protein